MTMNQLYTEDGTKIFENSPNSSNSNAIFTIQSSVQRVYLKEKLILDLPK